MKLTQVLTVGILAAALVAVRAADTPKAGDKAPGFEAKDQDGKTVKLSDFAANMVLDEDILGKHGVCILAKGQEITSTALQRLLNFSSVPLSHTYRVRVRAADSS